jgi:SAM-dependent methyltransferase
MRESQLTGRLRLRHLLEHTEAVAEEMDEERPRFERLAQNESAPRVVSSFNLFQTPEPLAARAAALMNPGRILEPSAGLGRLYRAARARFDSPVTLVEQSPDCCAELYRMIERDKVARLVQGDFLACDVARLGLFDSVLMNPPFKMGRDIKHIQHARTLLAPGGRLVAFCANGPKQRAALQPIASQWIDLEPKAFAESGTNVSAAIIVINA